MSRVKWRGLIQVYRSCTSLPFLLLPPTPAVVGGSSRRCYWPPFLIRKSAYIFFFLFLSGADVPFFVFLLESWLGVRLVLYQQHVYRYIVYWPSKTLKASAVYWFLLYDSLSIIFMCFFFFIDDCFGLVCSVWPNPLLTSITIVYIHRSVMSFISFPFRLSLGINIEPRGGDGYDRVQREILATLDTPRTSGWS